MVKLTATVAVPLGVKERGKKAAQGHLKRGVRICEKNKRADTQVSEEGGEEGASGTGAEIYPPAACSAELGEACALLSSMVEQRSLEDPKLELADPSRRL